MTKTTMLTAALTVSCCAAAAQAQVYVQPANYTYTTSQPLYGGPAYAPPAATYAPAPATYAPPVTAYYAGGPCGQTVCNYNPCCNSCCNPCATTYVSASPCVPQTVCSPAPCAPAPLPCGMTVRRGLLGQPVVHVRGQPIRNALRFLTP
jgi:hypothetical protein